MQEVSKDHSASVSMAAMAAKSAIHTKISKHLIASIA
jgi:hypothetical protein